MTNWVLVWKVVGKMNYFQMSLLQMKVIYEKIPCCLLQIIHCNRCIKLHDGYDSTTGEEKAFLANDDVIEKWNQWIKVQKMANTVESWCWSTDLVLSGKKCMTFVENEYVLGQMQWDTELVDIVNSNPGHAHLGETNSVKSSTEPCLTLERVMVNEIL